jgi:hypothetical protein
MTQVAVAAFLAHSYASPAHADDARKRAAQAYEDARKAFDGGAYQAAAVGFERVFREVPNGASMLAAGRAWEKAGEPALAADDFMSALSVGDLGIDESAKARAHLDLLEESLGRVHVLGPDGTTVSLSHAEAMRTPTSVHARPGAVTLVATLPDGSKATRAVEVEQGKEVTVDFRPAPEPVRQVRTDVEPRTRDASHPMRTAAWITGGGAIAAGIAAAILAPLFDTANDDWNASSRTNAGQRDNVVRLQVGTDATFIGACALAVTSATLFVFSLRPAAPSELNAPHVSLGPGWISTVGTW